MYMLYYVLITYSQLSPQAKRFDGCRSQFKFCWNHLGGPKLKVDQVHHG